MPSFTYTGDPGRYYPELAGGVLLSPGDVVDLDEAPDDGRFKPSTKREVDAAAKASQTEQTPEAATAVETPNDGS